MKKIEAVIFPVYLNAVRVALERLGIRSGLTLIEVRYSGGDRSLVLAEKRGSKKTRERVKLELIMEDSEAEKAVNIILRHARPQSDQEGGQIAVLEVNEIPSGSSSGGEASVRTGASHPPQISLGLVRLIHATLPS